MSDLRLGTPIKVHQETHSLVITLLPGTEQYATDLKQFIDAMVYKLQKNAHKGRWEDLGIEDAVSRMKEETQELLDAIDHGNDVETMLEAADVANFAMILYAIVRERGTIE